MHLTLMRDTQYDIYRDGSGGDKSGITCEFHRLWNTCAVPYETAARTVGAPGAGSLRDRSPHFGVEAISGRQVELRMVGPPIIPR